MIYNIRENSSFSQVKDILSRFELAIFPIWQQPEWGAYMIEAGIASEVFAVIQEKDTFSLFGLFEKRSIGGGQYIFFCLGGPLFTGDWDKNIFEIWLNELKYLAQKQGVLAVQIETCQNYHFPFGTLGSWKELLQKHTLLIDLHLSQEQILANMHQKGRYNIRIAEREGISVSKSSHPISELPVFYEIFQETLQRNHFGGHSLEYFSGLFRKFPENFFLYLAKDSQGKVLAGSITCSFGGTTTYYFGASTNDTIGRAKKPTSLLQWKMIQDAQERGDSNYDFLGIAPENSKNHPLAGVTDFKRKLSNLEHIFPPSRILLLSPIRYHLLGMIRFLKNLLVRK